MHMRTLSVVAALTMRSAVVGGVISIPSHAPAQRLGVAELLASARGVAPALCALASDGASSGWGGWDAPDPAIQAKVQQLVRDMRAPVLDAADSRVLVESLASDDACVRH